MNNIVELTQKLVQINSISPSGTSDVAQKGGEEKMGMSTKSVSIRSVHSVPLHWGALLVFSMILSLPVYSQSLSASPKKTEEDLETIKRQNKEIMEAFREAKKDYLFVSTALEYSEPRVKGKKSGLSDEMKKKILRS